MPPFFATTCSYAFFIPEILMHARQLFNAAVEKQEFVEQFEEAAPSRIFLRRYLSSLNRLLSASSSFHFRNILLGREDRAVLHPFEIVAPANRMYTVEKNHKFNSGC